MDHYINIHLRPDPEFPINMLMNALFSKLHRGLVKHGEGDIGLSFPGLTNDGRSLGVQLRLHGTSNALNRFMAQDWLSGMRDHADITTITPIPDMVSHRIVRRVQAKSSPERQRRRLISRKTISEEAALKAIPDETAKHLELPYVVINSHSTGQQFRLFIEHSPEQAHPTEGRFNAYGLSANVTIPWF